MPKTPAYEDLGIVLAMAYLAWTDRTLTEGELDLIRTEAAEQGLDDDEIETIVTVMLTGAGSTEAIAEALPTKEGRLAAAFASYVTALSDHSLSMAELEAFDALCAELGLTDDERTEVRTVAERGVRAAQAGNWRDGLFLERLLKSDVDATPH